MKPTGHNIAEGGARAVTYPSSKIITDSISPDGIRLVTHEVTCHRWILAEINTHRALSRNYRSSRAVPTAKLLAEVRSAPAMPVVWMKNRPGMQATEPMTEDEAAVARFQWEEGAKAAADQAELLAGMGLHKQWANRVIEPYLYVHGVITATDWANFYARRRAADAQPEFKALADAMWAAQETSAPRLLRPGEWHLPYLNKEDWEYCASISRNFDEQISYLKKLSVARCARVSIKPFDEQERNVEADLALHDRLWAQNHPSPFEHQATPDERGGDKWSAVPFQWQHPTEWGNFYGWRQYRKQLPNECVRDR